MRKFHVLLLFLSLFTVYVWSQESPKIDKESLIRIVGNERIAKGNLKRGDYFYKKQVYDEALNYYMKLFHFTDSLSSLNYKIGVSSLYGTNPKKALKYFLITDPKTTIDYNYQLGKALQQNLLYKEAKEAYVKYIMAISLSKQKRMTDEIKQLISECEFAEQAVKDSVPVFIINLGPTVNSFYDDYAAVELHQEKKIYFTTRRPKRDLQKVEKPSAFKERIFEASWIDGKAAEAIETSSLTSSKNMSVAGVDNNNNTLHYYKGKKQQGSIRTAKFKDGKIKSKSGLSGKINTKAYQETTFTMSDSGEGYVVSYRRGGKGGKDIYLVQRKGKKRLSKPRKLNSEINTPGHEEGVFITPNGKTLYFSSNGHPGMGGFDIYRVDKQTNGFWSAPQNMGYPINSPGDDLFYHPTADTSLALLSTKRQGGYGGLDLYLIKKDPRIPFELSGNVTDSNSGKLIPGVVTLFSNLDNLPVGSAYVDTLVGKYVLAMEDGGDFYIQVDAPGYRSKSEPFVSPKIRHAKLEQNYKLEKLLYPYTLWGTVTNQRTGAPIQAEILFKPLNKDTVIYRVVSSAQNGFYSITFEDKANLIMEVSATDFFGINENLQLKNILVESGEKNIQMVRSLNTYTLTGVIKEEKTTKIVPGVIKVYLPLNQTPIHTDTANVETGKYELNLDNVGPFLLEVTAEGYFFQNMSLHFNPDSVLMLKNFDMKKIQAGARIVIANILFNTGNATLKAESYSELNKLVNLLRENAEVKIEVSGHTDNVGSAGLNKKLSKSRALSVKNYLVSQGISGERVNFEGYGFDRPIAPNDNAEGRAANRRVEIEVLD